MTNHAIEAVFLHRINVVDSLCVVLWLVAAFRKGHLLTRGPPPQSTQTPLGHMRAVVHQNITLWINGAAASVTSKY